MKLAVVTGGYSWRCRDCGRSTAGFGPAGGGALAIWWNIFQGWRDARAHARCEGHDVAFQASQTIFASAPPETEWRPSA